MPEKATEGVIHWVYERSNEFMFKIEDKPDFTFTLVKGSLNTTLCSLSREYVFERYVLTKEGKPVCIPYLGYEKN
jgi:formylmethanofuran dehydrogenase subunit E